MLPCVIYYFFDISESNMMNRINYNNDKKAAKNIFKFLLLLIFLKLNFFSDLIKTLEDTSNIKMRTRNFLNLAKLSFMIIFTAHILACVWGYVGILEN